MKIFIFLLIMLISAGAAIGQNGPLLLVRVESGGVAAAGVVVTAVGSDGSSREAETDDSGVARFYVGPGQYRVQARHSAAGRSFASQPADAAVVLGMPAEVALLLEEVGGISETVTISADLVQPIEEVSKTVNVIRGREMRERADFTLVESLRSIPGFRVQQTGGFGRTASIKTRGLRNQDTAILLDGVRLRDPSAITGDATPFLSDITLTSVSRVEVLRGSGSSLYGTNSIGGTVNFITPEPGPGTHGQVSYAAGGLGLHRADPDAEVVG